ncbi:MAG TPA: hypothetical protein VGL05_30130 [Kribbella sp.]
MTTPTHTWTSSQARTSAAAATLSELLDQAAGDLNRLAPDLPGLDWSVAAGEVRGQVQPGTDDAEAAALLEAWAARLGLAFDPRLSLPGMREYWTLHNGWCLVIWGVTDAARWAEETRAATATYGPGWGWTE